MCFFNHPQNVYYGSRFFGRAPTWWFKESRVPYLKIDNFRASPRINVEIWWDSLLGNGPSPPPPPFNVETMATRPSRKRPSEWRMWTFLGSFPIVYRGKSQHWRGGRGREGYFPNKKIDEIRRFATEIGPKIAHFRPNRTLKQSILKSSCFHWSSRAQKSVSHSGHFEDG